SYLSHTLFPYTTLFRSEGLEQIDLERVLVPGEHVEVALVDGPRLIDVDRGVTRRRLRGRALRPGLPAVRGPPELHRVAGRGHVEDRKSTRLNCSHDQIS